MPVFNDLAPAHEPATVWRGAAMGNAGCDPVFPATLRVAGQDFDGASYLRIRCHSAGGWYGGRSSPTDGPGLAASDDNGINCDTCRTMTNQSNPATGSWRLIAGYPKGRRLRQNTRWYDSSKAPVREDGAINCAGSDCSGDPACQQADYPAFNDRNSCNALTT